MKVRESVGIFAVCGLLVLSLVMMAHGTFVLLAERALSTSGGCGGGEKCTVGSTRNCLQAPACSGNYQTCRFSIKLDPEGKKEVTGKDYMCAYDAEITDCSPESSTTVCNTRYWKCYWDKDELKCLAEETSSGKYYLHPDCTDSAHPEGMEQQ